MIETILTFYLIFTLEGNNKAIIENCNNIKTVDDGCYVYKTKTIYIDYDTARPRDFVLYHEIGHHLFWRSYDKNIFANEEIMADQFALFIYGKKFPKLVKFQHPTIKTYLKKYCDNLCSDTILSIKVPNNKYHRAFNFRTGFFDTKTGKEIFKIIPLKILK